MNKLLMTFYVIGMLITLSFLVSASNFVKNNYKANVNKHSSYNK